MNSPVSCQYRRKNWKYRSNSCPYGRNFCPYGSEEKVTRREFGEEMLKIIDTEKIK